jgi:DNA excision repair protein ERCC-2
MQTDPAQPRIVSVHSLVEFVLQAGDLTAGGFQKRDRAQAGTQGHQRVQRSRPEGYQSEVEITCLIEDTDPPMKIRGRIDGLYPDETPVIIEEIKTIMLSLELVGEDHNRLHWAQAQGDAYMLACQQNLSGVSVRLTYYHLDSGKEKTFEGHLTLAELEFFFRDLVITYSDWFRKISAWQTRRD